MEHTFVLRTDDTNFKEAIAIFLSTHCDKNKVNVAIYEMKQAAGEKVMQIVKER